MRAGLSKMAIFAFFRALYLPKMPQLLYYNINTRLAKNSQLLVPYKYTDHDECTDLKEHVTDCKKHNY